jgi:HD-GYP domain-containing protein (c-di-GMP phosphodiesterase class II)
MLTTALIAAVIVLAAALTAALAVLKQRSVTIDKIMKLYDIGKKITSNIKIKRLMKEIMELAKQEMEAEACTLYLVDEEKQELWFEVALGDKGDQLKEIRLKIGEGTVAGYVAMKGETLNMEDVNKDARFAKRDIAKKIGFKEKAMLTVPVKYQDRVVGVLQLINKRGGGVFTRQDAELMEGMTSQIAIALENAKLYKAMNEMFVDSIKSLANAIDAKDPYTNGHSRRVTEYSLRTGRALGLSEEQLEKLEYMAVLHDVGKIGIKDAILNKQAQLDNDEFAVMKSHTLIGAKILEEMKSLKELSTGARYHHEKFDGTGYYERISGENIPFEARIIAVADTYDAMTTDRPYRKGLEHEVAVNELKRCSGTQFDPGVVDAFVKVIDRKLESDVKS